MGPQAVDGLVSPQSLHKWLWNLSRKIIRLWFIDSHEDIFAADREPGIVGVGNVAIGIDHRQAAPYLHNFLF